MHIEVACCKQASRLVHVSQISSRKRTRVSRHISSQAVLTYGTTSQPRGLRQMMRALMTSFPIKPSKPRTDRILTVVKEFLSEKEKSHIYVDRYVMSPRNDVHPACTPYARHVHRTSEMRLLHFDNVP